MEETGRNVSVVTHETRGSETKEKSADLQDRALVQPASNKKQASFVGEDSYGGSAAGQERGAPAPDPILDKAAEFQVSLDEIEVLRPREALPNDVLRRGLLVEIIRRNQITHYKQLLFQKILIFSLRRELLCCTLIIEQSWEKVKTA